MILSIPLFQAYVQSDFFGKCIFFLLLTLSGISWVILVHKMKQVKKIQSTCKQYEDLFADLDQNILTVKLEQSLHPYSILYKEVKTKTLELLKKNRSYFETKGKNEVSLSSVDMDFLQSHVDVTIMSLAKELEKNLFVLSTVVTLGPFVGLLGTVWGILVTFSHMESHVVTSNNSLVLSGLSMALGATVIGLLVAIPALVGYNYLKNRSKEFAHDMDLFASRLLSHVDLQFRKTEEDR